MTRGSRSESDVQADPNEARTRATGGVPNAEYPDQNSTTGTTPNEEFVGRISGADVGYIGETGAERRQAVAKAEKAAQEERNTSD